MSTQRENLLKEYVKTLGSRYLLPIRLSGLLRFEIKNGTIITKPLSLLWKNIIALMMLNFCAFYVYYDAYLKEQYALITEIWILFILLMLHNVVFLNILIPNRNSGVELLNNCIDIDVILGAKETKFMRSISKRFFICLSSFIDFLKIFSMFGIIVASSPCMGSMITCNAFIILVFVFHDYGAFYAIFVFLTLRVRYLNVALIKLANFKPKVFSKGFLLSTLIWPDEFNDLVSFHERSDLKQFVKAFKIIFIQYRAVQNNFKFLLFMGSTCVQMSTFVMVQAVIIYLKSKDINPLRIMGVTGWVLMGWVYMTAIYMVINGFKGQIDKTILICTYIQLTCDMPRATVKIVDNVLNTIKYRKTEPCLYGIFTTSVRYLISLTLSMLVYIIIQLQLAFPVSNNTITK